MRPQRETINISKVRIGGGRVKMKNGENRNEF